MLGSTAVTMVVGTDETADVVDVSVGVVAGHAAAQPDHLVDAQEVVKCPLQLLAAHARVALLYFAQQALFRGQQDALAIRIDGPAFENEAAVPAIGQLDRRLPFRHAEQLCNAARQLVVEMPVVVFRPGIELPVGDRDLAFAIAHKNRARVARPHAIRGPLVKADLVEIGAGALRRMPLARVSPFAS